MTASPIRIALRVAEACEACGLRYLVGGSVASSIGGEPRTTLDVDMVVAIAETDVVGFRAALGAEFYRMKRRFGEPFGSARASNLIHQPSAIKVDLFIAGGLPLDHQQLDRRRRVQVSANPDEYPLRPHAGRHSAAKAAMVSTRARSLRSAVARRARHRHGAAGVARSRLPPPRGEVLGVSALLVRALETVKG